jgi:hypothetical protein
MWKRKGGREVYIPLWTSCLMNGLLGAADCAIFAAGVVWWVDRCVVVISEGGDVSDFVPSRALDIG